MISFFFLLLVSFKRGKLMLNPAAVVGEGFERRCGHTSSRRLGF